VQEVVVSTYGSRAPSPLMAARLASLPALARPAAPSRPARRGCCFRSSPRPFVEASTARRALTLRAGGEECAYGRPERRAVDKSEWIEAEAFDPSGRTAASDARGAMVSVWFS
jgi:hypothetical protein